ncbi:MAG: hypothetical protein GF329_06185 [Candidatus Lokiarchaeota archaeon]|nr:hypothetical protein [Candidatus Lokiarchaeota archaeon]
MNLKKKNKIIVKVEENCTGCRICQLRCSYINYKEFNFTKAFIKIDLIDIQPKIEFLEDCKGCFECAKHCLYGALDIKEVES